MDNSMVHSIFHTLEETCNIICADVTAFAANTVEWADELEAILEKEFCVGKDSGAFLLPKTPGEKRKQNRKGGKNTLRPNASVINSTFTQNETFSLNETVSTRTRGTRKATVSKVFELNITNNIGHINSNELLKGYLAPSSIAVQDLPNSTFEIPKATTRTKPVVKKSSQKPVETGFESPVSTKSFTNAVCETESSEDESTPKQNVETERTPPQRPSRSKTPSETFQAPYTVKNTQEEHLSRRKMSRTLSQSPVNRLSSRKMFRTLSGSPVVRSSVLDPSGLSPISRTNSAINVSKSSVSKTSTIKNKLTTFHDINGNIPEERISSTNRTVTIKQEFTPEAASTFVQPNETSNDFVYDEEEKTPMPNRDKLSSLSNTSTPARDVEKTPVAPQQNMFIVEDETFLNNSEKFDLKQETSHCDEMSAIVDVAVENVSDNAKVPKKKRKIKKDKLSKESVEEANAIDTGRMTRTKSKALKKSLEESENKQVDVSSFAKKLLNKAIITSMKKSQLEALLECNSSTPKAGAGQKMPFGTLTATKAKYHLLSSSKKKFKTPLGKLQGSGIKIAKASGNKVQSHKKPGAQDVLAENTVKSVTKLPKTDRNEKEKLLQSKKEKEREAELKRQNVIKSKQEELKRKNELKQQMAMKQREKLEQEKYQNLIQSEKEKEERHNLILQERQIKLKEEAFKKKMITQQKMAETLERRKLEEDARLAKIKEMEAEEQRLALERQKEQERLEKRAQERLAENRAREEYEMQLKQKQLDAERLKGDKTSTAKNYLPSASKIQSASKRQKFCIIGDKREWDYRPRNEFDYGLEDEYSEVDSEDERLEEKRKPAVPWAQRILNKKSTVIKVVTLEMLGEFLPCLQKSPDIHKMFKMTPTKKIKRTSSAIWNTPSSEFES